MGADVYRMLGPWSDDPMESLRLLHRQCIDENYDLSQLLVDTIEARRADMEQEMSTGDEYGLGEVYRRALEQLQQLAEQGIPESIDEQAQFVRECCDMGEGVGNMLDIVGIADEPAPCAAWRVPAEKMVQWFGSEHPTEQMIQKTMSCIGDELGRGEAACFPMYTPNGTVPVGWCFVGCTID